ncbi:MAG: hypothetical protein JRI47_03620 [Deltaproteobacteria bacterium]|nr:hypothetical protein [Deltaproteobacteria bacterium]
MAQSYLLIYAMIVGLLLPGCAPRQPLVQPPGLEGHLAESPKILKYGAVNRLQQGQTWRVFMAAEDPNGDMEEIIFELHQPGQGTYDDTRRLKGDHTKAFSGYFYLNTPFAMSEGLWGYTLTLTFRIRDKVGLSSEIVSLPVKFVGARVDQPVPAGFTEAEVRSLGAIRIQIYREDKREGLGWAF